MENSCYRILKKSQFTTNEVKAQFSAGCFAKTSPNVSVYAMHICVDIQYKSPIWDVFAYVSFECNHNVQMYELLVIKLCVKLFVHLKKGKKKKR